MNRRRYTQATLAAFSCGLLALAPSVTAQQVATAPDDTWIAVSGTVVSTAPDSLRLDYGDGVITVEMDDFDFFQEGRQLMENDQVVAYGKVDDDLFESRKIEARTVYVVTWRRTSTPARPTRKNSRPGPSPFLSSSDMRR